MPQAAIPTPIIIWVSRATTQTGRLATRWRTIRPIFRWRQVSENQNFLWIRKHVERFRKPDEFPESIASRVPCWMIAVFPNTRTRLMSEFSFSPRQRAGSTKASNCPNFHFAIVHAHLNVINVSGPAVASSRCRDVFREVFPSSSDNFKRCSNQNKLKTFMWSLGSRLKILLLSFELSSLRGKRIAQLFVQLPSL